MTTHNTTPRNAQQAMALALRHERALALLAGGYRFVKDAESEVIAVIKPGRLAASYWINLLTEGCDCPDALHGNNCKHMQAWDLLQDEGAGLEAQCAEYDDMEGYLDCIPTPTPESIALKDLVTRMEADLQKVNAAIAQHGKRRTNYITAQQEFQRVGRLENAIWTVNEYRQPPIIPPSQLCAVCGIANIHGPACFSHDCPNRILLPSEQKKREAEKQEQFNSGYECGKDLADDRI